MCSCVVGTKRVGSTCHPEIRQFSFLRRRLTNLSTSVADLSEVLLRRATSSSARASEHRHLPFCARPARVFLSRRLARHQICQIQFSLRPANSTLRSTVFGSRECEI